MKRYVCLILTLSVLGGCLGLSSCHWMPQDSPSVNVFDEIYRQVRDVDMGKKDVAILTGDPSSRLNIDFGMFVSVYYEGRDPSIVLSLREEKTILCINVTDREDREDRASYFYDPQTKILVSNASVEELIETYLSDYFAWCSPEGSEYSLEDMGEYTYLYSQEEYMYSSIIAEYVAKQAETEAKKG